MSSPRRPPKGCWPQAARGMAALLLAGTVAHAQPAAPAGDVSPAATPSASPTPSDGGRSPESSAPAAARSDEESRRHFDNGVKLYRDGNFQGALVEFEAAYELTPSAGALRNVGLCQKALFRYAEAAETLERLLARHGDDLSEHERTPIEAAITELEGLVGRVVLEVTPPDATIVIDGRTVPAAERAAGLRLNVGEHTITASAPGYARVTRVVSVASGRHDAPIAIALEPTMGFLVVNTDDPEAAIAVDGVARAFHRWSGPVSPGRHLIQIYKNGEARFERRVRVELGKSLEVEADVAAGTDDSDLPEIRLDAPPPPPLPSAGLMRQGWYAAGVIHLLGLGDAPRGMEHVRDAGRTEANGATTGIRAGYRLLPALATEVVVDGGAFPVKNACDRLDDGPACDEDGALHRDYRLTLVRLGANLRLLTSGEKLRFASSFGTGSVRQELSIPKLDAASADAVLTAGGTLDGAEPERSIVGWNAYFLLEVGAELNVGHALFGLGALLCIDGTSHLVADDGYQPYSGLISGGLALRAGWSEWMPRRGARLRVTSPH